MPKRRPDHVPQRSCAVCRSVHPKRAMARVVRAPDGTIAIDPTGRAPGRGTYICNDPACREPVRLAAGINRALGAPLAPDALDIKERHATA